MGQSRETGESSRLLVSAANLSTLLFLDASYWSRKAETGLCEQTDFKIASCRRQPCVPGCFSGHCDLAKPALRPSMFFRRLASNFSSDWLFSRLLVSAANSLIYSFSSFLGVQRPAKSGSLMGDPVHHHYKMTTGPTRIILPQPFES